MSYTVLARKWRPQVFGDVLGQEHVTRSLQNAVASERVPHAILLTGPRGVGKTTIARIFAKALCCEKGPTPDPCGVCVPCREIAEGSSVDVQEIDGASNRGVENARELREGVKYAPASARFKVYIIDEVHMLTTEAFNALLKTLEEPPPHVKFIFATTDVHKLPPTILSRVQRFDFSRIAAPTIARKLREIAAAEKIAADEGALAAIARASEGCMRDALTLLDQLIAYTGGKVNETAVREALGLIDRSLIQELVGAVIASDPPRCLEALRKLEAQGADVRRTFHELLGVVRDLVVIRSSKAADRLVDAPETELGPLRAMAGNAPVEALHALFDLFLHGEADAEHAALPFLVLEMCVLRAAHLRPLIPIEDLVARLDRLERGPAAPVAPVRQGGAGPTPREGDPRKPRASSAAPAAAPSPPAPAAEPARVEEEPPPISDEDVALEAAAEAEDAPAEPGGDPAWARYRAHVQEPDPFLASILGHARFAGIERDALRLSFSVPLYADLLRDRLESASRLLSECFGQPMRVIVQEGAEPAGAQDARERSTAATADESDRERALKKQALEHESVNQAVRILGGEIKDIKTYGA